MDAKTALWLGMMVACNVLPAMMLLFGYRFLSKPPEKINRRYGYRTKRSMRNMDTWLYAHQCCGKLWTGAGKWLLLLSLTALTVSFLAGGEEAICVTALVLWLLDIGLAVWTYIKVEGALQENFDEEGKRRGSDRDKNGTDAGGF